MDTSVEASTRAGTGGTLAAAAQWPAARIQGLHGAGLSGALRSRPAQSPAGAVYDLDIRVQDVSMVRGSSSDEEQGADAVQYPVHVAADQGLEVG